MSLTATVCYWIHSLNFSLFKQHISIRAHDFLQTENIDEKEKGDDVWAPQKCQSDISYQNIG